MVILALGQLATLASSSWLLAIRLILVVAFVVLVNGATGLIKVALLRFFKIGIFNQVRYPLHDHVRLNMGWSNTRFSSIHAPSSSRHAHSPSFIAQD